MESELEDEHAIVIEIADDTGTMRVSCNQGLPREI